MCAKIDKERECMENQFPSPPPEEWYINHDIPPGWCLFSGRLANKKVLDIGCATGWIAYYAKKEGANVIASDIFGTSVHPDLEFMIVDKEDMPFKDNTFDFVLTSNTLHHGDLNKTVSEIIRVLKPGGEFYSLIEPCLSCDIDEDTFLKENLSLELSLGIDERRPNLIEWETSLKSFSEYKILNMNTLSPVTNKNIHMGITLMGKK